MKILLKILFGALLLMGTVSLSAQRRNVPVREDIEWLDIWMPRTNEDGFPRVLLIGNSITRAYNREVEQLLEGKAYVARLATSKSVGDPALLKEIALILDCGRFDVVHFNNGMHGWGYSEEEYEAAFPKFVKTIRRHAPGARLVWASTTPVRKGEGMREFDERTNRIRRRNKAAEDYLIRKNIPVNDLFSFVVDRPEYYEGGDGVHPVAAGVSALARKVAQSIVLELERR